MRVGVKFVVGVIVGGCGCDSAAIGLSQSPPHYDMDTDTHK